MSTRRTPPRRRLLTALVATLAAALGTGASATPAAATLPGDNGRIAFVRGGDVWTAAADGSQQRRLTTFGSGAAAPSWSGDGQAIAFQRGGWVWTVNADGTDRRRRFPGQAPSWSPDSRSLAYVGTVTDTVDEGGTPSTCSYPAVLVRPLGGGSPHPVDAMNAGTACSWGILWRTYGPATSWTADGTRVVYSYRETTEGLEPDAVGIAEAPVSGAVPVSLEHWAVPAGTPAVDTAPRRDNYVFTSDALAAGAPRLYVRNRAGTFHRQLTADTHVSAPAHSPDNRFVLYTRRAPGQAPVVKRVTLGSTAAPVVLLQRASQPAWQPLG